MARNYQTKSNNGGLPDSITSTRFGGGEFNSIATELENAVLTSDQTLAPADGTGEVTNQLAMALAIYGAGGAFYHADTGAVNAYVLTPISPKESPPAYFDGFTVIFEAGTVNTTASTVNVNSLGVKDITYSDGNALVGGELSGSCGIKYNLSDDRFELLFSSGALAGLSQVYVIDASQADQGAASTNANTYTVFDAATVIGTSKNATLYFPHNPVAGNQTLYTFDTSLDLSSYTNLKFKIDKGAQFDRTTGDEVFTVYSTGNFSISDNQLLTTDDMLVFSEGGKVHASMFGAVGDGATDDSTAMLYASNSLNDAGGKIDISGLLCLIDTNLTIGTNVQIIGQNNFIGTPGNNSSAPYGNLRGVLIIDELVTVTLSSGAGINGVLIYRNGIAFPETDTTGFAGTAITVGGDDCQIMNCMILGFELAIYSSGYQRLSCEWLYADNNNGIEITVCADSPRISNCHFWPFATVANGSTGTAYHRSGQAIYCHDQCSGLFINQILTFGYLQGIRLETVLTPNIVGCVTDNTGVYVNSRGIYIENNVVGAQIVGCRSISNAQGFYQAANATERNYFIGCTAIDNTSNGFAIVSGDASLIGCAARSNQYGITVSSASNQVLIEGFSFLSNTSGDLNLGAASTTDNIVVVNSISDQSDGSSLTTGNIIAPAQIASAATISLPINGEFFEITGTTGVTTVNGGWGGRRVVLKFAAALTVTDGSNLLLAGNFTTTADDILELIYDGSNWVEISRSVN